MIVCPYCGADNIEGADACEQCGYSLTDLYLREPTNAVERGLLRDRIAALAPKTPVVVAPELPVGEVLNLLVDRRIGCVLVVEDGRLAGIFSERDALLKLNTETAALRDRPVGDFMTANVETLEISAKIAFAVQRMDLGSYRHLPIVGEDGKTIGVISARDILRYLTEKSAEPA